MAAERHVAGTVEAQGAPQAGQAPPGTPAPPVTIDIGEIVDRAVKEALQAAEAAGLPPSARPGIAREEAARIRDQVRATIEAARQGAVGSTEQPPFSPEQIPPQVVPIVTSFFVTMAVIAIGVPLARAFARRMDRRGQQAVDLESVSPRLDRIEQAIEAVAIEVERVSESQRYTTRILSELRALPASNPLEGAMPGAARGGEPVPRSKVDSRP
jgi:hypothetical protein